MKNKKITLSRPFEKTFSKLPNQIRELTYKKLDLLRNDPSHPSLRVKRMQGTGAIWEMSITMNYRLTFEIRETEILLRRIGTHDLLNEP